MITVQSVRYRLTKYVSYFLGISRDTAKQITARARKITACSGAIFFKSESPSTASPRASPMHPKIILG